ncbi:MAG: enoyl-CoA hydratase/isomerase family protein [Acidimicrobiales bacterium]|nr:enoyl-CoA hydratase/isomerase family protein [Acidimicrobiales bacterium]
MTTFDITPDKFRHWDLSLDAEIATLTLTVDPAASTFGTYELKLNSYDIGVDIELANAIRHIRLTHPNVKCVVITSGLEGTFCAGANIRMLAAADHSHKVNFCKYTNETRLEIEEASALSGIKFLAAVNGACSGGGYELALACDHILLVDDKSTSISLPEVPLLGVLPGTGGLTRLTDKRHVRRDRADIFATKAEGMSGKEALDWGLVDELATPTKFGEAVARRASELAASTVREEGEPIHLSPMELKISEDRIDYRWVKVRLFDSHAELKVFVDADPEWLLRTALELDDVLCRLRFDYPDIGTLILQTEGSIDSAAHLDAALFDSTINGRSEIQLLWKKCLTRLDLTAKTLVAAIEPGSCFVGILFELALAADRIFMLDGRFEDHDNPLPAASIRLTHSNFGTMPMWNELSRLSSRFWGAEETLEALSPFSNVNILADQAAQLGLVSATPDDLDWDDELRLSIEERSSFSADALTAMEANLRFSGPETMATKIFARLSAWQNWVFTRSNASGPLGALQRYGSGSRPEFDNRRT